MDSGCLASIKCDGGLAVSLHHLAKQLVTVLAHGLTDVGTILLNDFCEERRDLVEVTVAHIVVPSRDENAVIWLNNEVIANVVDDDRLAQGPAQQTQVFHQEGPVLTCVLPIQSVLYVVSYVNLVDDLVGVFLERCCEDYNLVILCHSLNEVHCSRTHQEEALRSVLHVVNQRFIQVQNQAVCLVVFNWS